MGLLGRLGTVGTHAHALGDIPRDQRYQADLPSRAVNRLI